MSDWIPAFLSRHRDRVPRADWPEDQSAYWDVWFKVMIDHHVREDEADEASMVVGQSPPQYFDRQVDAFLGAVRTYRDRLRVESAGVTTDRAAAESESRGCEECGGSGLTARFVWIAKHQIYARCGCCCHRCAAGRWLASYWADKQGSKPFDLDSRPDLWDEALRYGPPADAECAIPATGRAS